MKQCNRKYFYKILFKLIKENNMMGELKTKRNYLNGFYIYKNTLSEIISLPHLVLKTDSTTFKKHQKIDYQYRNLIKKDILNIILTNITKKFKINNNIIKLIEKTIVDAFDKTDMSTTAVTKIGFFEIGTVLYKNNPYNMELNEEITSYLYDMLYNKKLIP